MQKCLICQIPKSCNLEKSKNLKIGKFEKFEILIISRIPKFYNFGDHQNFGKSIVQKFGKLS